MARARLISGYRLSASQRQQVLAAFVHRWTFENAKQTYGGRCPACVQQRQRGGAPEVDGTPWHEFHVPLISDEQWLREHAFYIRKDGQLDARRAHCEPISRPG